MQKGDKLYNFKSKQPETRAFKGTCYAKKRLVLMGELNHRKKCNI